MNYNTCNPTDFGRVHKLAANEEILSLTKGETGGATKKSGGSEKKSFQLDLKVLDCKQWFRCYETKLRCFLCPTLSLSNFFISMLNFHLYFTTAPCSIISLKSVAMKLTDGLLALVLLSPQPQEHSRPFAVAKPAQSQWDLNFQMEMMEIQILGPYQPFRRSQKVGYTKINNITVWFIYLRD